MPDKSPQHKSPIITLWLLVSVFIIFGFFVVMQLFEVSKCRVESNLAHFNKKAKENRLGGDLMEQLQIGQYQNSIPQGAPALNYTDLVTILGNIGNAVPLILLDLATFSSDFILSDQSMTLPIKPITFGIFEKDRKKFEDICNKALLINRLIAAQGVDYRLMRNRKSESAFQEILTHYFLILDQSIIVHFAIIFPRNDYFWVGDLQESILPTEYRYLTHLEYSIPLPMAIQQFKCTDHPLKLTDHLSITACKPNDIDFYLWQLPLAKFHECHFNDIVYPFRQKFPDSHIDQSNQITEQPKIIDQLTNKTDILKELMLISKQSRVPAMILEGTLLGWYRQCDHIPGSDIDMGILSIDYQYEFYRRLFQSDFLKLTSRHGTFDLGLELKAISVCGIPLDVHFLYPRHPNQSSVFTWSGTNWYETVLPQLKGICSAELLGILTHIPCNYQDFVIARYGHHGWFPQHEKYNESKSRILIAKFEETDEPFLKYQYKAGGCERPNELWGCDEMPEKVVNSKLYQNGWMVKKLRKCLRLGLPKKACYGTVGFGN